MSRFKKSVQPHHWHPNFRISSTLPDVKIVRSSFVINGICSLFLGFVVVSMLWQEYNLSSIRSHVDRLENRIRETEANNNLLLRQTDRFRELSRHIIDVERFYFAPFKPYHFISELVRLKPPGLAFDSIEYSEKVNEENPVNEENAKSFMNYTIRISGRMHDLDTLSEFKRKLKKSNLLKVSGYEIKIHDFDEGRNLTTSVFSGGINIEITPEKGKSAGQKGRLEL